MFVLVVNQNLVPLRLGAVFVSLAFFPYCEITISGVTGPTKVARGSLAEYVIGIEITENDQGYLQTFSRIFSGRAVPYAGATLV